MSSEDGPTTRDQILAVALARFSDKGFTATTTREITGQLGITPAALYYHFSGKDACLVALVEPYMEAVEGLLERHAVDADGSPRDLLLQYAQLVVAHGDVARLIDRDPAVANHAELGSRLEDLSFALWNAVAGPDADGRQQLRASAALGALRRPLLRMPGLTDADVEELVEASLRALGSG